MAQWRIQDFKRGGAGCRDFLDSPLCINRWQLTQQKGGVMRGAVCVTTDLIEMMHSNTLPM